MAKPDYRSLCARMADELDEYRQLLLDDRSVTHRLADEARAALAEPEPAGQTPPDYIDPEHTGADRELLQAFYAACQSEGGTVDEVTLRGLRAAIAADRAQRHPQPEQPTRRHLMMLAADMGMASVDDAAEYARVVLARWGHPAPQPPADGEVADVIRWLRSRAGIPASPDFPAAAAYLTRAADLLEQQQHLIVLSIKYEQALSAVMPSDFKDWWENSKDEWPDVAAGVITNLRQREELAWEQVERLSPPQPVPMRERPWGREGWCDEQGKCWWGRGADNYCNHDWHYATRAEVEEFCSDSMPQVSLPSHALPLPGEVE